MVFMTRPSSPSSQAIPYAWPQLRQRVFPRAPRLVYYGPHKEFKRLVGECSREDVIVTHYSGRVTLDIKHKDKYSNLSRSPR